MSWAAVAGATIGAVGAAASKPKSSSTSNQIDSRLAPYVYGEDGKGGLLGDVAALYKEQAAQGGMNEMQRAGLESQRQVYASPQYTQGYDAMRSMGLGLLGGGVSQNPFTSGGQMGSMGGQMGGLLQRPMTNPSVVRPNTNMQYTPYQPQQTQSLMGMQTPIQSVSQYQASNPVAEAPKQDAIDAAIDEYMKANKLGKYQWADSVADGAGI